MTLELSYGGLHKVISGGQTGADQGGLLAAWKHGVETGGTAPANYLTQTGRNPLLQLLRLTPAGTYATRTRQNIKDADATVVIAHNLSSPGTKLTLNECLRQNKPHLPLNIRVLVDGKLSDSAADHNAKMSNAAMIREYGRQLADFCKKHQVLTLNVAGNREILQTVDANGDLIITSLAEQVVSATLEQLKLEGLLIFRS